MVRLERSVVALVIGTTGRDLFRTMEQPSPGTVGSAPVTTCWIKRYWTNPFNNSSVYKSHTHLIRQCTLDRFPSLRRHCILCCSQSESPHTILWARSRRTDLNRAGEEEQAELSLDDDGVVLVVLTVPRVFAATPPGRSFPTIGVNAEMADRLDALGWSKVFHAPPVEDDGSSRRRRQFPGSRTVRHFLVPRFAPPVRGSAIDILFGRSKVSFPAAAHPSSWPIPRVRRMPNQCSPDDP